jgi:hypothetical protein
MAGLALVAACKRHLRPYTQWVGPQRNSRRELEALRERLPNTRTPLGR